MNQLLIEFFGVQLMWYYGNFYSLVSIHYTEDYHEVDINNIKLYALFCVNLTFYLETSLINKNRNISGIHGHCHGHGCPSLYIEHFYLVLIIYILSSEKPLVLIIGCPKL